MALLQDRRCENCGFSTWYFSYEWSKCQFSPQAAPLLSSPLLILEQTASPFYNFDRSHSSINILPEVIRHPPAHRGFELGLGEIVTRYFIINLRLFPLLVRIGDDISNPSREVISILDQITTHCRRIRCLWNLFLLPLFVLLVCLMMHGVVNCCAHVCCSRWCCDYRYCFCWQWWWCSAICDMYCCCRCLNIFLFEVIDCCMSESCDVSIHSRTSHKHWRMEIVVSWMIK